MMNLFKKKTPEKERAKQRKLLEMEVEKQGVLAIASRLDTASDQREFINDYWSEKILGYDPITESEENDNDRENYSTGFIR